MQILEYHVYAAAAYEESDFAKHSTLEMVERETVKVSLTVVLALHALAPLSLPLHYTASNFTLAIEP